MHSALSRRSWGMSSGILRISLRTSPESLTRSCSFSLSAAKAGIMQQPAKTKASSFLMGIFLSGGEAILTRAKSTSDVRRKLSTLYAYDQTCTPFVTWHRGVGLLESWRARPYLMRASALYVHLYRAQGWVLGFVGSCGLRTGM